MTKMNKGALKLALAGAVVGVCGLVANVTSLSEPGGAAFRNQPAVAPAALATPAPVDAPAPTVTAPVSLSGEQQAFCKKHEVKVENCANIYELVQSGQPVEGINHFDNGERDSYSDFRARQQQRQDALAYCAKNRGDWSCSEGQYRGQY
jgi:hypothetical protein